MPRTIHRRSTYLFTLLLLLGLAMPAWTTTAAQLLGSVPAPNFRAGNTLPRLTQAAWNLDYDTCVALADQWGYGLIFQGSAGDLDDPTSLSSQLCALSANNPQQYPLAVMVPRPFQDVGFLNTLPASAWSTMPYGQYTLEILSPLCPDSAYQSAGTIVSDYLATIQQQAPINMLINAGEDGLTVMGKSLGVWTQDPAILATLGPNPTEADWDHLISGAKANGELIIQQAALAAAPTTNLYEFYTTDGDPSRGESGMSPSGVPDNSWIWCWEYANMRPVSSVPSTQMYYNLVNSGWTGSYPALTVYLNSVAQQLTFGDALCYNWVNAGSTPPPSANDSDDAHYIGMLKCMYTAGMIGGTAVYYNYPANGFTGDQGTTAPPWLQQMEDLAQVHALFTHLEKYLRSGSLLPGPDNNIWSTDLPAYEFPTGDATARVLARQLNGQSEWLICAWAEDGANRDVSVTIPILGTVTVLARATGSVYRAKPGPVLSLLDSDGLQPTASLQNITATSGPNGAICSSGYVVVPSGGSETFTFTPNAEYHVSDVQVDGISQGALSSYTFTDVTANHTINVTFAPLLYTLTVQSQPEGILLGSLPQGATPYTLTLSPAAPVSLTAPATAQVNGTTYPFAHWSVNGKALPAGHTTLSFAMSRNITVMATYQPKIPPPPANRGVSVQLLDSDGNGLAGAVVTYYNNGWQTLGTTGADGCVYGTGLAPGAYLFAISYLNVRQCLAQTISANSVVTFRTTNVTVELQNSQGQPLDSGTVEVYSGGWHALGNTSGGQVQCELLPGAYLFGMTYLNTWVSAVQDIGADATVVFQTAQVHSLSGHCTSVYGGGWQPFTQDMQLLPGSYLFSFATESATVQEISIEVGVNDIE